MSVNPYTLEQFFGCGQILLWQLQRQTWSVSSRQKRAFALRTGFRLLANATLHLLHYSFWVTDCMSVQCTDGTLYLAALFSSLPSRHAFPSPLSSWEAKQKSCTEDEEGGKTCPTQLGLSHYPLFPPSLVMNICPDQQTGILF